MFNVIWDTLYNERSDLLTFLYILLYEVKDERL